MTFIYQLNPFNVSLTNNYLIKESLVFWNQFDLVIVATTYH